MVRCLPGCLVMFVLLGWPGRPEGASRRPYGGALKIPVIGAVKTTDPALVGTPAELELARQLHETLFRLRPDGTPVPQLAQDLPRFSSGGRELVINLRPGATFHDGTPVTAVEVIASWKRLLDPQTGSPHWWLLAPIQGALAFRQGKSTKISGLEPINRLALRIRLRSPLPGFLESLGAVPTAPLPAKWLHSGGPDPAHPPGCGPFAWSSTRTSEEVTALEYFGRHMRGRPLLDRLLVKAYQSARAAMLAFQLEEVHLSLERLPGLEGAGRVVDGPQRWMVYLALNSERVAGLPQGFRRAVEQAVDRRALVEYLVGDRGMATDEVISVEPVQDPGSGLRGDPKAAKEYFKRIVQHGKGVPPVLVFLVRQGQPLERSVAERIQVNLVDIGVVVSVVEVEREGFEKRIQAGEYDFFLARPLPLVRDPELQLMSLVARLQQEADLQGYFQSVQELPSGDNRPAMIRERARLYGVRFPWIPLFQHSRRVFLHEAVHGYVQGATGLADFAETWLAQ